ncbi:MAG TPA: hypothetical protein VI076_13715 [Actinopolymorphaceae bacterium]
MSFESVASPASAGSPRHPAADPLHAEAGTFDDLLADEAVLAIYRQMFAPLARHSGAVVTDPALVDVAEALFDAFARAGEEGLNHEEMRAACQRFPDDVFESRLAVLRGLAGIRETFPKPHQRRYRASFTSVIGLMFIRRMMADGGQSEMHRLLALEQLSLTGPDVTVDDARASARGLIRAFRLWTIELAALTTGKIEDLREQAPKLWGSQQIRQRAEDLHAAILDRWPELDHDCAELRSAIYAYGDVSLRAAARLRDSAGTTRNLSLLPAEAWRTFAQTADADRLAAVLEGFVFDAPAAWHAPADVVAAVDEMPRAAPPRPAPPRSSLPDAGLSEDARLADEAAVERLRSVAEQALGGGDTVALETLMTGDGDWTTARRLLADLTTADLRPDLPYRLRWSDTLAAEAGRSPAWVNHGTFERVAEDVS